MWICFFGKGRAFLEGDKEMKHNIAKYTLSKCITAYPIKEKIVNSALVELPQIICLGVLDLQHSYMLKGAKAVHLIENGANETQKYATNTQL